MIKNKVLYALFATSLLMVWFFGGNSFAGGMLMVTAAMLPLSAFVSYSQRDKIHLFMELEGSFGEAHLAEGRLIAGYQGFLPFVFCRAELHCENLLTGDKRTLSCFLCCGRNRQETAVFRLSSRYCGKVEISVSDLRLWDWMGLFSAKTPVKLREAALMIPEAADVDFDRERFQILDPEGVNYSDEKAGFDPSETFAVREYRMGDKLKSIHWKLTGKLDRLMVREPGLPVKNSTQLLMETAFPDENAEVRKQKIDTVCGYTVSLSEKLIDSGFTHQIGWMDYRENFFHNYEINSAEDLSNMLGLLLGTAVHRGESRVAEKFCEETGKNYVPDLVIIDDDKY